MRPSSASALLPCRGLSYATSRAEQTSGGGWGGVQSCVSAVENQVFAGEGWRVQGA